MISVIIPVYNGEKWLNKSLNALERQTIFDELEIIIINDGSVDNSKLIIDDFDRKYKNVKVKHIANQGVSNARNVGIEISTGEYIAFIDVDDYIESNYFEMLLDEMDSECDIVCSGYVVEYTNKSIIHKVEKEYPLNNKEAIKTFLYSDVLDPNVWNKLFRRTIIGERRFNRDLVIGEDRCFLFDCLCDSRCIKMSKQALYHYVMNDDSVTHSNLSRRKIDSFLFVKNYILQKVNIMYPDLIEIAESAYVDSECRMYADIYRTGSIEEYQVEFEELRSDIRHFSIIKKIKHSSKKHTLALLAAKISPKLYIFLKYGMKLQYVK